MSSRNLSVLLVEDSRVLAERLRETLLSVPGVQLAGTVDSEADAVAALQRHPVDVLLLDLHLRQGTGFGVLRAIPRDQAKKLVVIVLTNYDLAEYRRAAAALGRATSWTSCATSIACPRCCSRSADIAERRRPGKPKLTSRAGDALAVLRARARDRARRRSRRRPARDFARGSSAESSQRQAALARACRPAGASSISRVPPKLRTRCRMVARPCEPTASRRSGSMPMPLSSISTVSS